MRHQHSAFLRTFSRLRSSDERLVARAARGDESALAEFYDRYAEVAYGLALRILREPSLAEAVVADAFVSVVHADPANPSRAPDARTCLLALVHQKAVEASRGRSDPPRIPQALGEESEQRRTSRAGSWSDRCKRALALLPDDQRQTLELAYFDGLSIDELTHRVGQPRADVCWTLRAALYEFQEILKEPTAAQSALAPEPEQARRGAFETALSADCLVPSGTSEPCHFE